MSFKNVKLVFVLFSLMFFVFGNALMAACGSNSNCCSKTSCCTEKSLNYIITQIKILENIDPRKHVEDGAKAIQNILCEMERIKFSDSGIQYAKLSEGNFRKTLANLGKSPADFHQQACYVTYPFALYYFGKLFQTELNQKNPYKGIIWFYINRRLTSAKAAITSVSGFQVDPKQFALQQSVVYQKAANYLKVLVKLVAAIDNLSETQRRQIENLFKRCQFDFAQKDYAGFNKNFALLEAALMRLKGIVTADNC